MMKLSMILFFTLLLLPFSQISYSRHYDPESGRFLQEDPISDFGNQYIYVKNNPINYSDPTGLIEMTNNSTVPVTVRTEEKGKVITLKPGQTMKVDAVFNNGLFYGASEGAYARKFADWGKAQIVGDPVGDPYEGLKFKDNDDWKSFGIKNSDKAGALRYRGTKDDPGWKTYDWVVSKGWNYPLEPENTCPIDQ